MSGYKLTQDELKKLIKYYPKTGLFIWLPRGISYFKSEVAYKAWDSSMAHTIAGSLSQGENTKKSYYQIQVLSKVYHADQLAWLYMTGSRPKYELTHLDGDKTNNAFSNLEDSPYRMLNKRNVTGFRGVTPTTSKKYRSYIHLNIDGKQQCINLGTHSTFFDAVCARKSAENKMQQR